jgi:hypothetical protein
VEGCELDSYGSECRLVVSSCEHSNEPLITIKCGEYLEVDWLLVLK